MFPYRNITPVLAAPIQAFDRFDSVVFVNVAAPGADPCPERLSVPATVFVGADPEIGDFLVRDAAGAYAIVPQGVFQRTYRPCTEPEGSNRLMTVRQDAIPLLLHVHIAGLQAQKTKTDAAMAIAALRLGYRVQRVNRPLLTMREGEFWVLIDETPSHLWWPSQDDLTAVDYEVVDRKAIDHGL